MALEDDCDKILAFALTKERGIDLAEIRKIDGMTDSQFSHAVNFLLSHNPPLFARRAAISNWIDLTSDGRSFADNGGFSGEKQREQTEQLENRQDKQLTRLVNKSVLDTNASILDTNKSIVSTNNSVQQTNQSVQSLNSKTETIYDFQKKTTWLTIGVACAAVVVALLGLFKDEKQLDIQPLLHKQEQMQTQINLLRDSLKALTSVDTPLTKRP